MALDIKTLFSPNTSIPKEVIPLYERYLLACPAIGASIRSSGFIDELGITTSALAKEWLRVLDPNHDIIQFFDSAADLEKETDKRQASNQLFGPSQYYLCTRSEKACLAKSVKRLNEYSESESSKLGKQATQLIMRRYYEVDSVYRHIRNALAHGCFQLTSNGRFIFFDTGSDTEKITALGMLTTTTLEKWYEKACSLAEKKL